MESELKTSEETPKMTSLKVVPQNILQNRLQEKLAEALVEKVDKEWKKKTMSKAEVKEMKQQFGVFF